MKLGKFAVLGLLAGVGVYLSGCSATDPAPVCDAVPGLSCSSCSGIDACADSSGGAWYETSDGETFDCSGGNCSDAATAALSHCGCI